MSLFLCDNRDLSFKSGREFWSDLVAASREYFRIVRFQWILITSGSESITLVIVTENEGEDVKPWLQAEEEDSFASRESQPKGK